MDSERVRELAQGVIGPRTAYDAITLAVNEALESAAEDMCREYEGEDSEWIPRAAAQKRIRALKLRE
jgi:hypothetical protein